MQVFRNMDFYSPRVSAQYTVSRKQNYVLYMTPFPRMFIQLPGGRLITLDHSTSIMQRAIFFPNWNAHILHICICLIATILLKLPSVELQNGLSTDIVFHTVLLGVKNLTSQQNRCDYGPILMDFIDFTIFPHHLEAAGLIKWCKDLLKMQ